MKSLSTLPLKMPRLSFALILALLAISSIARADDVIHYYDVEAIIFESLDPAARTAENWKVEATPLKTPVVSVDLGQPLPNILPAKYDPKLSFQPLPVSEYKLNDAEKLMVASKQYRILLHTAWVQPGLSLKEAIPVHISQTFLAPTSATQNLAPATADTSSPTTLPAQTDTTQTHSVLNGYIKIILTRYLHAEVNLRFTTGLPLSASMTTTENNAQTEATGTALQGTSTPASPPSENLASGIATSSNNTQASNMDQSSTALTETGTAPSGAPTPVTYVLHQERKMRPNVLHYLDHPVLGVLLLITRHDGK